MRLRHLSVVALCLAAGSLVGCSNDRFVVHSTAPVPKGVAIVDVNTNQTLWSKDIPVGQTLVLDGDNVNDFPTITTADSPATSVDWAVYNTTDVQTSFYGRDQYWFKTPIESGTADLHGSALRIDVTALKQPEVPTVSKELESVNKKQPEAEAPAVEEQMEEAADAAEPLPEEAPATDEIMK